METKKLIATDRHSASMRAASRHLGSEADTGGVIPVGVSACLVGHSVRYNGGHSQSKLCMKKLAPYFAFRPFCPEVAAGFSVPRPTMRLMGTADQPRLVYSDDHQQDLSAQLRDGFREQLALAAGLHGYVLMKNSPSCGLERVKVYAQNGYPQRDSGRGLFTSALMERYPELPLEEEGRLNDPHLRENFVGRVYAHFNFTESVLKTGEYCHLMRFHARYKYYLMAHNQTAYQELGRLLASHSKRDAQEVIHIYFARFMAAIAKPASRRGHTNVMLHLLGYLKRRIPGTVRQDVLRVIEQYRSSEVNLATPLTLLAHYIRQLGSDYIRAQSYLNPYPANLGLRNFI